MEKPLSEALRALRTCQDGELGSYGQAVVLLAIRELFEMLSSRDQIALLEEFSLVAVRQSEREQGEIGEEGMLADPPRHGALGVP